MKKTIIAGGLTAMLLASAALYAAPGANMGKMKMDADGNGSVTKTESLAAADTMFAKMDINKDGKLDQADREAKVKEHFAKLDKDSNGSVTQAEFLAANAERQAKWAAKDGAEGGKRWGKGHGGKGHGKGMGMLKKADANGDKVVTQAEFRTAAETRFAKNDTNKDGSLSADEMKAGFKGKHGGHKNRMAPPPEAG